MTARTGSVLPGAINAFADSAKRSAKAGSILAFNVVVGSAPPIYKNKGWYAAGSVFETWVSTPLPGTNFNPVTTHFLSDVDHVLLDP